MTSINDSNVAYWRKLFELLRILSGHVYLQFSFIFLMIFLGSILEIVGIGMTVPLIKVILSPEILDTVPFIKEIFTSLDVTFTSHRGMIFIFVCFVVLMYTKNMFLGLIVFLEKKVFAAKQLELSKFLFSYYLCSPYSFHINVNSSHLFANVTAEMNALFGGIITPALLLVSELIIVLGIGSLLLWYDPYATISIIVIFLVGSATIYFFFRAKALELGESRQGHNVLLSKSIIQSLHGIKDLQVSNKHKYFLNEFEGHCYEFLNSNRKYNTIVAFPRLILELLAVTGLFGAFVVLSSKGVTTEKMIITLSLFAGSAFKILPSMNRIISSLNQLKFNTPSLNKIYSDVKLLQNSSFKQIERNCEKEFKGDITFDSVNFSYSPDSSPKVITNLSHTISEGDVVGVVGPSGAGKSTLVDILTGILTPCSGDIFVGGTSIFGDIGQWRDSVGYVPQSVFLLDDTLKKNIAFGVSEEEIDHLLLEKAITDAQLDQLTRELSSGVETILGERGVKLSGGQRQRIGIARALYKNPSVLIFDESTSALDNITEKEIMESIFSLARSRTVIIIAHRLSTVERCDYLMVLDEGKLTHSGSYSCLQTSCDLFAKLALTETAK